MLALVVAQPMVQAADYCWLPVPSSALPANLSPTEPYWTGNKLPIGWKFGIGPALYNIGGTYTGVGDAILAAAAQWNSAVPHRQFGWDGQFAPTTSDCPSGRPSGKPFQIGALNFSTTTDCPSLNALKTSGQFLEDRILAYSDYYTSANCSYPQCGTKSVTINLARSFTTSQTPLPGVVDLQSVLVHEMGHSFGLTHMNTYGECRNESFDCEGLDDNVIPSMQNEIRAGQICQRTIKGSASTFYGDYSSIKQLYPNE